MFQSSLVHSLIEACGILKLPNVKYDCFDCKKLGEIIAQLDARITTELLRQHLPLLKNYAVSTPKST
jgi:hypothetical protein